MPHAIISRNLLAYPRIGHGFFTRNGGVSKAPFTSLNCGYGSGDDPETVRRNRNTVAKHFGLEEPMLLTPYQTHSATVLKVEKPWEGEAPKADALVTATPDLLLGVLTADCAPVLLCDATAGVVAAVHAGWKGALAGIVENTVRSMQEMGAEPSRIAAAIGPCIGKRSYEVGPEFVERFVQEDAVNRRFFSSSPLSRKPRFDLAHYIKFRLQCANIQNIESTGHDTCDEVETFFSYRRATLRKESAYGRQISCIMVE